MMAFADGFLAYHVEVSTQAGCASQVARQIKEMKGELRSKGTWPGFPDTFVETIKDIDGVEEAVCEGPQSSLLIPLRMIKSKTGIGCTMSSVLGAGEVTEAIDQRLSAWGIQVAGTRKDSVDSPIEVSVRELGGITESVRLYPASRTIYRQRTKNPAQLPEVLICNRVNNGIETLATAVSSGGGLVSVRPRDIGRYDNLEDYDRLLGVTHHLVLSSRHGVLKAFARHSGLSPKRHWSSHGADLSDAIAKQLAQWLLARMPGNSIVAFVGHPSNQTVFFCNDKQAAVVPAPDGYDSASRAARIQGALLARVLTDSGPQEILRTQQSWDDGSAQIVTSAFEGTEARPWRY